MSDCEGADVAVVQVGEAFVEIRRVVGGAVVAVFEASLEVELQTGLEAEGEVAETAQRLRAGIDEEYRDRQQLAFDAVDAGGDGLGRAETTSSSPPPGAIGAALSGMTMRCGYVAGNYRD